MDEVKSEYYHYIERDFPEEKAFEEYDRNRLTIDEMRDIYTKRRKDWGCHTIYDIDLLVDENNNLYYTNHNFVNCDDLLVNHLLAEQLIANKKKVDWKRVTNCYDYAILDKLQHLLDAPLVWTPTEDVCDKCVVVGKCAKEVYPHENYSFMDERCGLYNELRDMGLLWFADTLPVKGDLYNADKYDKLPDDMVVWDRLVRGGFIDLHRTMEFIIEKRGYAKAVEIINLYRRDWPDIISLRLFDYWKLETHELEHRRLELFDHMEPYMRAWRKKAEIEAPKPEETTPTTKQSKPTELHVHFDGTVEKVAFGDIVNTKVVNKKTK